MRTSIGPHPEQTRPRKINDFEPLCQEIWSLAAAPEAKLVACAVSVFVVLPIGVALGVVFVRTRNLLAPSILNVLANTIA